MSDVIETNFDLVYNNQYQIEYEKVIEFEFENFKSLIYSITNNTWKTWYIDEEGEEIEEIISMEEFKKLKRWNIDNFIIEESQLLDCLGIVLLEIKK